MITFSEFYDKRPKKNLVVKSKDDPTRPVYDDAPRRDYYKLDPTAYKQKRGDEKISEMSLKDQLNHASEWHGLDSGVEFEKFPKDGSYLYRGHKHPDPFSKSEDAKADGNKAYFSNNILYAYKTYSRLVSQFSPQIGQSGLNEFQDELKRKSTGNVYHYFSPFGYLTIATPNNPDEIVWYNNFGYEDKTEPISRNNLKYDSEAIVNEDQIKRMRSYLITGEEFGQNFKMIPFNVIKAHYPELYNKIQQSTNIRTPKSPFDT